MSEVGGTTTASWPLASLLTIVFVILKLTSVIDWSWWWVLSPLWISALFSAFLLIVILIIIAVVSAKDGK